MASGSFEFTAAPKFKGKINWSSTSNGSSANSSNLTVEMKAIKTTGAVDKPTHGKEWGLSIWIDGEKFDFTLSEQAYIYHKDASVEANWTLMASKTKTITHNDNGTRQVEIKGEIRGPSGTSVAGTTSSGSQTVTLDTIPRYTSITKFELASKTSNSITINWQAADACDYGWYSLDNGNTWTGGLSYPNQTISGLSPNTTYNVKIRVRRQDSQLTTDSNTLTVKTYANTLPSIGLSLKSSTTIGVWSTCNVSVSETKYRIRTVNGGYGNYQNSNTFNGLTPNTDYIVQVRCVGQESGYEGYAETPTIRTYQQTIASISLSSKTSSSITVNSSCNVEALTAYRIKKQNGKWSEWGGSESSATFSGLEPNTTYTVEVRKTGIDSAESHSKSIDVTTYQATRPSVWITSRTSTSITVSSNCNVTVSSTQYRIRKSTETVFGSYQNSPTFTGLTPNTNYIVQVRCVGQASGEAETAICGGATFQATIPTLRLVSKTVNSIDVTSSCNIAVKSTKYRIKKASDAEYGTPTSAASFKGLSPNTTYNIKVECVGLDNNELGDDEIEVKTYETATLTSVSNINFGDTINIVKTNPSGTTNEISILTINPEVVIARRSGNLANNYYMELTDEEWNGLYRKLGTSNSMTIRYNLKTIAPDGRAYQSFVDKTLTLTGNQKTAHIVANNVNKRAQVYVGVNGNVKKAVVWIGNNGKKRCI